MTARKVELLSNAALGTANSANISLSFKNPIRGNVHDNSDIATAAGQKPISGRDADCCR